MQRFVNDPDYIVDDMVKGFVKAHEDLIVKSDKNDRVVKYKNAPVEGKVGLVTGGGSGHEPAFLGYVGENMMDAVAVGEVFSSPSAQAFYDAFMEVDAGKGAALTVMRLDEELKELLDYEARCPGLTIKAK